MSETSPPIISAAPSHGTAVVARAGLAGLTAEAGLLDAATGLTELDANAFEGLPALAFDDAERALAQLLKYADDLNSLVQERADTVKRVELAHLRSLQLLSRAAELRDDDTGEHMERVGAMAEHLARLIGRSDEEACMLRLVAPMHDIGKVAMPDQVLKKPGAYSAEDRCIMNTHTLIGAQIIGPSEVPMLQMAAQAALTHHECWDGSGYPHGLRGEDIPWFGRVIAIVDFFDAMGMSRVYRKACTTEYVLEAMRSLRGTKFDPLMLEAFLDHVEAFQSLRANTLTGVGRTPPTASHVSLPR